jgi:hypothetical protein
MAGWCLTTGQPASEYLRLTRLERDVFYKVAAEALRRK